MLVALVVALLLGATAGGVASRAVLTSSSSTATVFPVTTTPAPSGSTGAGGSTATVPDQGSTGSSGSSSGTGSTAQLSSWGEVAAKVDVGVVDIESRVTGASAAGTGMVLTATGRSSPTTMWSTAPAIVVTVVTTGKAYRATVVGHRPADDVAVLQLNNASGLPDRPAGRLRPVAVGDAVAAIGNAGGVGGQPTVATGRVTALDQQITAADEDGTNPRP